MPVLRFTIRRSLLDDNRFGTTRTPVEVRQNVRLNHVMLAAPPRMLVEIKQNVPQDAAVVAGPQR